MQRKADRHLLAGKGLPKRLQERHQLCRSLQKRRKVRRRQTTEMRKQSGRTLRRCRRSCEEENFRRSL